MFSFHLLVAAVAIVVHVRSVSAFQPGSDYNAYKTTNLYNCTGHAPISNVTVPNVFDTLPQIDPSSGQGWEQWSLFLHGSYPVILRWNQGNPSSSSVPSPAHFDFLINVNGTTIQSSVQGDLSYTDNEEIKQIAIGGNSLTWDSSALWYNVSVNMNGYQMQLDSFSATLDSFHPNVGLYNGLLDESGEWFGSVPIVRGQVVGNLVTPTKNTSLEGLTVIRHIFSENPLPSYIKKYSGGTLYGYSTTFYDTHVFYHTEKTNGSVHEAAFLGRALPIPGQSGGFSSAWATYAVTDDPLYNLSVDDTKGQINASFSGCTNTTNIPYLFNTTGWTYIGEITDAAGGKTSYYNIVNGTTTAAFDGSLTSGAVKGIFEEYQAP